MTILYDVWINKGIDGFVKADISLPVPNINYILTFADFNGDGLPDLLSSTKGGGTVWFFKNEAYVPQRIIKITDYFYNESTITYAGLDDTSVYTKGSPVQGLMDIQTPSVKVVSKIELDNGLGGTSKQYYRYKGLRNDKDRGSQGFEQIEIFDDVSVMHSVMKYSQHYPLSGMLVDSRTYLNDKHSFINNILGEKLSESTYAFEVIAQTLGTTSNKRIRSKNKTEKSYVSGVNLKTTLTTFDSYDSYGNILDITVHIKDVNNVTFTKKTKSVYANYPENWILSRLMNTEVTHTGYGDTKTRHSSFTYYENGILKSETVEPDTAFALTKEYVYDSYGNKVQESVVNIFSGERRTTNYMYDAYGQYVSLVTNPLGHTQENIAYDKMTGKLLQTKGPNGRTTQWSYNAWGQQTTEIRADGTTTQLTYTLLTSAANAYYSITSKSTNSPATTVHYDVLSRKVREESIRFDGERVFVDYHYDEKGRMYKKSSPYTASEAPLYSIHTYDKYHREIGVSTPAPSNIGGSLSTTVTYDGYANISTDAKNKTKKTVKNVMDKIVSITDEAGLTLYYAYDALGNLISTVPGNDTSRKITMYYDILGNKIAMDDPDMGHWEYRYDGFGQLYWQKDAKGQVSTMVFDVLGRMTTKTTTDGVSTWVYDNAPYSKGKLVKEMHSIEDIEKSYAYDDKGRPVKLTTIVDGKSYIQTTAYDATGRVSKTTLPKGFEVINTYNDLGYLDAIKSPAKRIEGFDFEHFQGLMNGMLEKALEYHKAYVDETQKARELILKAEYYSQLAKQHGARAKRLKKIAQKLRTYASRHMAYVAKYRYAEQEQLDRIAYYNSMYDENTWTDLSTEIQERAHWNAVYQNRLVNNYVDTTKYMLNHVTLPTNQAIEYEALVENNLDSATDYLDDAQKALNSVIKHDAKRNYYLKLEQAAGGGGDVAQAYVDMIADTEYAYHYKVLAVDSYGRVTKYLSGNGLVTEDSYDDSGAMTTSKTGYNGEASIRDLSYEYDSLYNLEQRTDKFLGVTSSYIYDELSRIANANFVFRNNGNTTGIENMTYDYDAYGNIIHKSDIGDYLYEDATKPNRLTRAGDKTFAYDANGNMLKNDEINLAYNAANKTTMIATNSGTTTFAYDMNNNRYQKTSGQDNRVETTTYIGKVYEHTEKEFGFYEDKYFIYAHGKVIAVNTENHANKYESSIRYLHHDALGSVDAITNAQGEVVQRSAYKPFGERITLEQNEEERSITNRGYTGHEEIEGTRLVHMNARLYDPTLGRFMSADTLIQDPYDTQSYNRYSYVRNNPLKYTDPSGHSFKSVIKAIVVVAIVAIVGVAVLAQFGFTAATAVAAGAQGATAIVASGAIAGFAGGYVGALLDGASPGQALVAGVLGGVIGGLTAGISNAIGTKFALNAMKRAMAHGVVSGITNLTRGGNFIRGFMSSFASSYLAPLGEYVANGNYYGRTFFSATVGGTVSSINGGKFANGAVTSAFQFMFNDALHPEKTYFSTFGENVTVGLGAELNTGIYWTEDGKRWGYLVTLGGTLGFDASLDYSYGWIYGAPEDLAGFYFTGSVGIGFLGGESLYDSSGNLRGGKSSLSVGVPVSYKYSATYTWLRDGGRNVNIYDSPMSIMF